MAFVNEYISKEDFERYKLSEIDSHYHPGTNANDWTVDRTRDIYLRNVSNGREEFAPETWWTFYWHGELLSLQLDLLDGGDEDGGAGWSHWSLRRITTFQSHELADHLKKKLSEIRSDLKQALVAYKDGGVFSQNTSYSVILDVDLV